MLPTVSFFSSGMRKCAGLVRRKHIVLQQVEVSFPTTLMESLLVTKPVVAEQLKKLHEAAQQVSGVSPSMA